MLPRANPAVIFQRIDDGAVLFAPHSELYFGLNEVGAAVWESLPPTCETLESLCARLAERYPDTSAAVIEADVLELLDQLTADGLVVRDAAIVADAPPAP